MLSRMLLSAVLLLGLVGFVGATTPTEQAVARILAMEQPPFGVVFEIVEGRGDALAWALPEVNRQIERLRQRFPDIGVAVVTHGSEQFALASDKAEQFREVHETVQSLVKNDVPVHVCGTHASWKGKTVEDFPDYVDVTPAGPTEIRNYQSMGYELIVVKKPR